LEQTDKGSPPREGKAGGCEKAMWDTIVIGAGPGGVSAAIWSHRLGLHTLLLDARDRVGGQLLDLHGQVVDYPGLMAEKGYELAPKFAAHLAALAIPLRLGTPVQSLNVQSLTLHTGDPEPLHARALILATGARRRRLEAPGADRLWGHGLSDSPTRDLTRAEGKVVGVVGGGDAALENALILARVCPEVHLIHRRARFRAREGFQDQIKQRHNVTLHMRTVVTEVIGDQTVRGVRLLGPNGSYTLALEMLFVKIGVVPCSELVKGQMKLTPDGYVIVDTTQKTSEPGVYAVGDVCNPIYSSIAHAVGQGMVAAKTVEMALSGRDAEVQR